VDSLFEISQAVSSVGVPVEPMNDAFGKASRRLLAKRSEGSVHGRFIAGH